MKGSRREMGMVLMETERDKKYKGVGRERQEM
jgi:hypothetical protein